MKSLQERFYKKKILTWITLGTVIIFVLVATSCAKKPPKPALSPEVQKKIEEYIAKLGNEDINVVLSASTDLIKSIKADSETMDPMIMALTDEKQSIKVKIRIAVAFESVLEYLNDENKRKAMVEAATSTSVLWAESEEFPLQAYVLRWHAYDVLRKIGGLRAEEAIENAKKDDNWLLNPGLKYLQSSSRAERTIAGMILSVTDARAVEPLLVALEKETELSAKRREVEALGEIGDPRALPILEKIAASDENEKVRQEAEEALRKIRQK